MNESFLCFIWQHQYFSHSHLVTEAGEPLQIHRPGFRNTDAGPDFTLAHIEIDGILWVGSVEIHVRSSDWNLHLHTGNKAYGNVILHVVWENDVPAGSNVLPKIPMLCMGRLVTPDVTNRYHALLRTLTSIPCAAQFETVPAVYKTAMTERLLLERLERKTTAVLELHERTGGDWNEVSWQLLTRYFGFKVNADTLQQLAERLPLRILLKHRDSLLQLESLLFGTANLIPHPPQDPYQHNLLKEFRFLAAKYKLENRQMELHEWRFLRLRPAGFPTVRIAQLACLIHREGALFSALTIPESVSGLERLLRAGQSEYWGSHYHFGYPAAAPVPCLGREAAQLLIINVVVPLLAAYSVKTSTREYLHKSIRLLEQLPPEQNRVIREWKALGLHPATAAGSQAALEWHQHYCTQKRCLHCQVGNALIRPGPAS